MKEFHSSEDRNRQGSILLIEDDEDTRLILKTYLSKSGFQSIGEVTCGNEAQDRIENGGYDLVLLDWNMPGLQGIEVLRNIREQRNNVPIIMLTAQSTQDRVLEALDAGASAYLTKPFTKAGLLDVISQQLKT